MRKIMFLLVAFFMFGVTSVYAADTWDGSAVDKTWYDATKDTFTLDKAAELAGLAELVNNDGVTFAGKKIVLANDIDLNNHLWTPVGNSTNIFAGDFDGKNHTINKLADGTTGDTGSFGLFGYVANSNDSLVIQNLKLTNVNIKQDASGKGVGALIGYAHESGVGLTIKNVTVSGLVEGIYHVGGVVGKTYSGGDILFENVVNNATVTNKGYGMTGGIVGIFSHSGSTTKPSVTFKNVTNNGNVSNATANTTYSYTNAMQVSGIAGNIANAVDVLFENCINNGKLTSSGLRQMSGLANIENAKTLTFKDCTNNGDIEVTNFNNYNTNISTASLNAIGGLFAHTSVTEKMTIKGINKNTGTIGTLASGKVYSGSYTGGIFGSINPSHNNITISVDADAKLINEGDVYARRFAGGIAGLYNVTSNISNGTFENTGNVMTKYAGSNEISAAGGIFGSIINITTSNLNNTFKAVVDSSEITAYGYGEKIHNAPDNAVAAGGYVGYNTAYNISNSNVSIKNAKIEAISADAAYKQSYAGGVYGLNTLSSSNPTIGKLENIIVTGNEINGNYAGQILGTAYDSYSATGRKLLDVAGNALLKDNEINSEEEPSDEYLGLKVNKAYINFDAVTKYTVTFETNGGKEIDSVEVDVYTKLTAPEKIGKKGYTFAGWYTDEKLENEYDFDTDVVEDLTLYAKWTEEIKNPPTGDNIMKYMVLAIVSLVCLTGSVIYTKKRYN